MFMGVHEYSLARGAALAFFLGYVDAISSASRRSGSSRSSTSRSSRRAGGRGAPRGADRHDQIALALAFTLVQSVMILVLLAIFGRDA